jgi:hypothetical protein
MAQKYVPSLHFEEAKHTVLFRTCITSSNIWDLRTSVILLSTNIFMRNLRQRSFSSIKQWHDLHVTASNTNMLLIMWKQYNCVFPNNYTAVFNNM